MYLPLPRFQCARPPRLQERPYRLDYPYVSDLFENNLEKCRREKRKYVESKFHLLPLLPKEIRLQIWHLALPSPKLLELSLFQHSKKFWARRIPSTTPGQSDSRVWRWECPSSTPQPQHLFICRESLSVVRDHYVFLDVYCRFGRKRIYCDYKRDTIYFSKENWALFLDSARGRFPSVKNLPVDVQRVSNLAISSRLPHTWLKYKFRGAQQFNNPGGRRIACESLRPVFSLFPKLSRFLLTVDGRRRGVKGSHLITEANEEEFHDFYRLDGRENYAECVSSIGKELGLNLPELRIPNFELGVLINEQPLEEVERRWDYAHATCHFCIPGFDGHRRVSRSSTGRPRYLYLTRPAPLRGDAGFVSAGSSSDSELWSEDIDDSEDAFQDDYEWSDSSDSDASRPRRGRGAICHYKGVSDSDESDDESVSAANANFNWECLSGSKRYPVNFDQTWEFAHPG